MAIQKIVPFTKPEAWKKTGVIEPGSEFVKEFCKANPWFDVKTMTSMRYFLRAMGESNGFRVLAMRKAQLPVEAFVKHYQHVWKYPGAIGGNGRGWALEMVNLYASMPLWYFLIEGEHDKAKLLRGPTNGADARNPASKEFAPFSIRGFFGKDKYSPQFHMTDVTPYDKISAGELDAEKAGLIETVRFFLAGRLDEKLGFWPIENGKDGKLMPPSLEIFGYACDASKLPAEYAVSKENAALLKKDFDAAPQDIAAFIGTAKYREFFGGNLAMAEPLILPELSLAR